MGDNQRNPDGQTIIFRICRRASQQACHDIVDPLALTGDARRKIESEHHPKKERGITRQEMIVGRKSSARREDKSDDAGRENPVKHAAHFKGQYDGPEIKANHQQPCGYKPRRVKVLLLSKHKAGGVVDAINRRLHHDVGDKGVQRRLQIVPRHSATA